MPDNKLRNQGQRPNFDESFRGVLNYHGHPFQHAVTRIAEELRANKQTGWALEFTEFPVNVRGKETHIDLVLRQEDPDLRDTLTYMVGECKRTNPALSTWCFVRAPYTRANSSNMTLFVQNLRRENGGSYPGVSTLASDKIYNLGFVVKTKVPGDDKSDGGRNVIQEAAGQVCLGLNGMLEFFADLEQRQPTKRKTRTQFLPVVFTTARVLTSEVDLGSANIRDGKLPTDSVTTTERPWIWLNYPVSRSLKHSRQPESSSLKLGDIYDKEYLRSIAIVSATEIEEFLRLLLPFDA
jgi:hypothetical protein